jgi:OOP family OmpA-OmpF porin
MILRTNMKQKQTSAVVFSALALTLVGGTLGCTTKNYVRSQTAPIVANVNDLDTRTAADHNAIISTDEKATAGIANAQSVADAANQHALAARTAADQANGAATEAANRVDSLSGVVANLDQYKPLQDVSVTFGFDKATLTPSDKQQLDALAANLTNTRGYILQLTGGTDSVGNAQYNYQLSQRRADAVVSYLSARYNVPPHKFYLVGIGKDEQIASDKTAAGRAKNRRVDVQLLSNMQQTGAAPATGQQASLQ